MQVNLKSALLAPARTGDHQFMAAPVKIIKGKKFQCRNRWPKHIAHYLIGQRPLYRQWRDIRLGNLDIQLIGMRQTRSP